MFGALEKKDATSTQGIINFIPFQEEVGEPVKSERTVLRSPEGVVGGWAGNDHYLFIAFVKCL